MNRFECVDCVTDTSEINEYYMVRDELWFSVGMSRHGGMLCLGCLEQRLGRKLIKDDFTDALVNWVVRRSDRMMDRLGKLEGGFTYGL